MRSPFIGFLVAASLPCLASCASMGTMDQASGAAPQPLKRVDVGRFYTGVWREIGRRPMSLTDGCVAGATAYTFKGGSDVDVVDSCRLNTPAGELKTIGGPARITDPGTNAKLSVSYRLYGVVPIERDYWILDHADYYSWFISSDPTFHDLWIYTRDPAIGPAERRRLINRAKALGYDVSKLEFPAQPAR